MAFSLKEVREKAGVTQEQLAEKIGVTRQSIGSYENGVVRPSVDVAKAIGKELDFDWTLLYS